MRISETDMIAGTVLTWAFIILSAGFIGLCFYAFVWLAFL